MGRRRGVIVEEPPAGGYATPMGSRAEGGHGGGYLPHYDTPLSADEERQFEEWKARYAPEDSGGDYDLRGAYKAGLTPDPLTGHWPDTYKKPNHPTFSDQSQYAKDVPKAAGSWDGDTYVPPGGGQHPGGLGALLQAVIDARMRNSQPRMAPGKAR